MTDYKTHPNFSRANQEKKKRINIKSDEINIMNIINDNTFNLHNSLLNNDNRKIFLRISKNISKVKIKTYFVINDHVVFGRHIISNIMVNNETQQSVEKS